MIENFFNSSRDILERAISTAIQSCVAILATTTIAEIDMDLIVILCVTGLSTALSVFKSGIASRFGDRTGSLISNRALLRDPSTGRFVSRRVSFESEEIKKNGD
jgi:hypothetical protein